MPSKSPKPTSGNLRVGVVRYLNARPLTDALAQQIPDARIVFDVPSRLADQLAEDRLDVALIPSVEVCRQRGAPIVSDACVACRGPVLSVRLFGRVPVERLQTVALDEGSRTSAALAKILLRERFHLDPRFELLGADVSPSDCSADAMLLIGDRAMRNPDGWPGANSGDGFVWDLGQQWLDWTGLPFVFAVWVTRAGLDMPELGHLLALARDQGVARLDAIARQESPRVGLPVSQCLAYLRDHLQYRLGNAQREGLREFVRLAVKHGLVPDLDSDPTHHALGSSGTCHQGMQQVAGLLDRAVAGERLDADEGLALMRSHDLAALAQAADRIARRRHPEPYRTYNVDRNINYTNICVGGCRFCAFSTAPGHPGGWILDREELFDKIEETISLGGDQILLQGGMHPELGLDWYVELLGSIRHRFPEINIHGFGPAEIHHIARTAGLSVSEVLVTLKEAGLGSLPGGGAEILVDRVRQQVSRCKVSADGWLDVCRQWHALGGRGSATMMFGHVETLADRVAHLMRLRELQDETNAFTAFICWTFQPDNTELAPRRKVGSWEYLRTLAVSRILLDNFANLQASWVTQGLRVGQLAMGFGANDMGSIMIEENVVAAAGTRFATTEEMIRKVIQQAGFEPRRRDVFYASR